MAVRTVKLHCDGWLHLPEELARELGRAGAVSIECRDDGLFIAPPLRPEAAVAAEPTARPGVTEPASVEVAGPVKRGRGRPRKAVPVEASPPNPPEATRSH